MKETGGSAPLPSSGVLVGGSGVGVALGIIVAVGVRVAVRVGLSAFVGEALTPGVESWVPIGVTSVASPVAFIVAAFAGVPGVRSAVAVLSGTVLGIGVPMTCPVVG